tara:strand:+ start:104109 stop:104984 length:876 start_codon:yes stop_codon:yes gene_type:complete
MKVLSFSFLFATVSLAATLGSYNIRNFDYDEREHITTNMNVLQKTISNMDADLIAVQEIREKHKFKSFIENRFNQYNVILSECGGFNDQHLGFIFNQRKFKLLKFWEDMRVVHFNQSRTSCRYGSRPLAIAKFLNKETKKEFIAISVHLKSGGSPQSIDKRFKQLEALKDVVRELKRSGERSIIIMGDFNSTEYNQNNKYSERFKRIVKDMDLLDLSERLDCTSYWWGGVQDGMNHPSVLDHILVTEDFYQARSKVLSHCERLRCSITEEYSMGITYEEVSDHCPQVAPIK